MFLRLFPITTLFTLGALLLTTVLCLASSQDGGAVGLGLAEMLSQSLFSAALSGLLVDGLRVLAQTVWPAKKKPKLALRKLLNANLG